ncbi:hypothetical protein D3C78_1815710 [compost metagenome]
MRQLNARAFNMLVQTTTDVTLHVLRIEVLLAATLNAYTEGLAFQLLAVGFQRLLENMVDIGIVAVFHFQNVMNAGNAR